MTLKKLLKIYRALDAQKQIECHEKTVNILVDVLKKIHEKVKKK